jgi:hypothetical protein
MLIWIYLRIILKYIYQKYFSNIKLIKFYYYLLNYKLKIFNVYKIYKYYYMNSLL